MTAETLNRSQLDPDACEPIIDDAVEARDHRKHRLALGYRVLGALGWGLLGDGHISARDPLRPDSFWLARYGVPFRYVTVDDLVLVGPDGSVDGGGRINAAAYYIHAPIHQARPDAVSAVHTHTPYGTPFSATVVPLEPVSQEACAFFEDHAVFDDEEVDIVSTAGGHRIARALGPHRGVILRNHGLLTVGTSVDSAIGNFLLMERSAEVQLKAGGGRPISAVAARRARAGYGEAAAWHAYQWALRTHIPDTRVVNGSESRP
jgi:ribulose-5-phosphate 4-epimerase/fuculose-1-phosphate aldolase